MEKKTLTKKIIITILLGVLVGIAIYGIIKCVQGIFNATENISYWVNESGMPESFYKTYINQSMDAIINYIVFVLSFIGYSVFIIIYICKNWIQGFEMAKLSIEEYKQISKECKRERLVRKKEKLEKVIKNLSD